MRDQEFCQKIEQKSGSIFNILKNDWIAISVIIFLFSILSAHSLINDFCFAAGYNCERVNFGGPYDRMADLIKLAMAFIPATELQHYASAPPDWANIYKFYLLNNDYLKADYFHFHMPPLMILFLFFISKLIILSSPNSVVLTYIVLYIIMCIIISYLCRKLLHASFAKCLALTYTILFSYPALYMVIRGNLTSYTTLLLLLIYTLTITSQKHRLIGILCLAAAINIRPNLISFALVEVVSAEKLLTKSRLICCLFATIMILGFISYILAHFFVPEYSVTSFIEHLKLYNDYFSVGDEGWPNNFSLYGLTKTIRFYSGEKTLYSDACYFAVSALGISFAITLLYLAFKNYFTQIEALFLGAAYSCLFTPAFDLYHMIIFNAPLLPLLMLGNRLLSLDGINISIFIMCILCLSPIFIAKSIFYPLSLLLISIMISLKAYNKGKLSLID